MGHAATATTCPFGADTVAKVFLTDERIFLGPLVRCPCGEDLGVFSSYGIGGKLRKAPAVAAKMLGMVATAPDRLSGLRDRALLLLGFAGAFRRSELVALDVADIAETETGLLVTIRHSKTDQEGQGVTIAIARGDIACPGKALRAWLDAAGIEVGPLFRPISKAGTVAASRLTCRSLANIVKAYAGRAGLDASTFSGHSLRSGFLTSAAGKGASIFKMMDVSRHKSVDTLRGYVRDAELFKDHAAGLLQVTLGGVDNVDSVTGSHR
jgi:integrase